MERDRGRHRLKEATTTHKRLVPRSTFQASSRHRLIGCAGDKMLLTESWRLARR